MSANAYTSETCRVCNNAKVTECNCSDDPQYFQILKILDELQKNLSKLD